MKRKLRTVARAQMRGKFGVRARLSQNSGSEHFPRKVATGIFVEATVRKRREPSAINEMPSLLRVDGKRALTPNFRTNVL
jgi:hypothetical protein